MQVWVEDEAQLCDPAVLDRESKQCAGDQLRVSPQRVLQVIEGFKAFTPAFIISGGTGGPVDSTLFYTLFLYQEAFAYFRMGYAAALAWVLLVIIGCFTALSFFTSKYWVHYEDER